MADQEQALMKKLRVEPGEKSGCGTATRGTKPSSTTSRRRRPRHVALAKDIDTLQDRLYAEGSRALLVILQGTDTSGKDGTIRGVFNATGPFGVSVHAFRRPSEDELAHDYLWRVHDACPRRGTIGIFNRSHYEDVLVVKVRKLAPEEAIEQRYEQINAFEKMLSENGTTILKFMLHISKKEQKRSACRSASTIPTKHWKFNPGDLEDREHWDEFQDAYETMLAPLLDQMGALARDSGGPEMGPQRGHRAASCKATLEEMDPQYPEVSWKPGDFKIE